MAGRIFNWKLAGILAAAMGISAVASGCGPSQPSGVVHYDPEDLVTDEPVIESTAPATDDTVIEVNGDKYLIEFGEEDYVNNHSIDEAVEYLYDNQDVDGDYLWLDTDLLKEEIAYANALVEAYDNDMCPASIIQEAKLLSDIKAVCNPDSPYYTWERMIAEMNSFYNAHALDSYEGNNFLVSESGTFFILSDNLKWLLDINIKDDDAGIVYSTCKLIHEACCDYEHMVLADGYSYCTYLDEFMKMCESDEWTDAFRLRLTK